MRRSGASAKTTDKSDDLQPSDAKVDAQAAPTSESRQRAVAASDGHSALVDAGLHAGGDRSRERDQIWFAADSES